MSSNNNIVDNSGDRNNFTIIPNIIDDLDLSVYAFRLYFHIKRRAGENGNCWESTATLAKACNMSTGMVSKAKTELAEKGLITITHVARDKSKPAHHNISVDDIWMRNILAYEKPVRSQDERTPTRESVHHMNEVRSPHETIKNPINKEPIKKDLISRKRDEMFDAVADVSGLDPKLSGSRIAKASNLLKKAEYTPDQVRNFLDWWKQGYNYKQSKRLPTPEQIMSWLPQSIEQTKVTYHSGTIVISDKDFEFEERSYDD